jgi:cystathionine beta-lyase/cystathionine gamma-synthase
MAEAGWNRECERGGGDPPAPDPRPAIGTLCVHGAALRGEGGIAGEAPAGRAVALPIHQTSTFRFQTPQEMFEVFEGRRRGYLYTRYDNPTLAAVEEKIAALESAEGALLFASGMAAISSTLLHLCGQGDLLLAQRDLYGGTQTLLSRFLPVRGVRVETVDVEDDAALAAAFSRRPKVFYFESPTNPLLRVPDAPALCRRAAETGTITVMDSTFATPVLQHPLRWGVDLVVHSGTKYLAGHSDLICGAVAGSRERIEALSLTRRLLGGIPEPWSAFLLDRGLKTLEIRVLRQARTARELAERLESHPAVEAVHYPGLPSHPQSERAAMLMPEGAGGVVSFALRGGRAAVERCLAGFRWIQLASSLGGTETLISHPASSSHIGLTAEERAEQGIGEGLLRVSVGLEGVEDLWMDLRRGLERA